MNSDIVILSDWHLGQFYCRDRLLLPYIQSLQCSRLIVNGDGIDLIEMDQRTLPRPGKNFVTELENRAERILPRRHYEVLRRVRYMTESGIPVDWVVGNHDAEFRNHFGQTFFGATLADSVTLQTPANKNVLIVHGDRFDPSMDKRPAFQGVIDFGYFVNLRLDIAQNGLREAFGLRPFSTPKFIRRALGFGQAQLDEFRRRMTNEAIAKKADVIVCGHIHEPEDAIYGSVRRINTGDFTESYTGAVIGRDGDIAVFELPLFTPKFFRRIGNDISTRRLHPTTCPLWLQDQMRGVSRTY